MTAPARWPNQHTTTNQGFTVTLPHITPDPLLDARLQLLVDECRESFELTTGYTDGTRSEWLKFWAAKFERAVAAAGRAERLEAAA